MKPFRLLVPLDGSPFAESVLMPAAFLTAALAFPAQGEMQLAHIVKSSAETAEKDALSIVNEEAFQHARGYLDHVKESLREIAQNLKMTITSSVRFESDIVRSVLAMAEQGAEGVEACDLIALSTHGRSGLPHWTTGNMTERILNSTKLPILVI
jgi:nucleotide-binding universal stress UspA family protein